MSPGGAWSGAGGWTGGGAKDICSFRLGPLSIPRVKLLHACIEVLSSKVSVITKITGLSRTNTYVLALEFKVDIRFVRGKR